MVEAARNMAVRARARVGISYAVGVRIGVWIHFRTRSGFALAFLLGL